MLLSLCWPCCCCSKVIVCIVVSYNRSQEIVFRNASNCCCFNCPLIVSSCRDLDWWLGRKDQSIKRMGIPAPLSLSFPESLHGAWHDCRYDAELERTATAHVMFASSGRKNICSPSDHRFVAYTWTEPQLLSLANFAENSAILVGSL